MFAQNRPHRVLAVVTAATFLIAACASQDTLNTPTKAHSDLLGLDAILSSSKGGDTQVAVLMIDPATSAGYSLGHGNKLYVRAGGICDLESTYGPDSWDLPCLSAAVPVLVIARTWNDANQHPHVDFWPELRFVPSSLDERPSAELWLKDVSGAGDDQSTIRYCNSGNCVDEGTRDQSLVTKHDRTQGYLFRRIKHFSGYQVSTGRDDEPTDSTGASANR